MKTRVKALLLLFILAVIAAGIITGDEEPEAEPSGKIPDKVVKELQFEGIALTDYYITTGKTVEEALGVGINESSVVFTTVNFSSSLNAVQRAEGVVAVAEAVFRYNKGAEGLVMLLPARSEKFPEAKFIHVSRENFKRYRGEGLAGVELYNSFDFFGVPKERFVS